LKIAAPVVILGARSDIGRAIARLYAARGHRVVLAARGNLDADGRDLELRTGASVRTVTFDVTDGAPDAFFAALGEIPGTVVMVAGLLGEQARSVSDDHVAAVVLDTNFAGPARYLLAAARVMSGVEDGCIIGISSVAGDRGRGSNFIYGSAKAGLSAFLSGLRNAHARSGLHVITVKPGFVATQMTAGMKLPPPLTTSPEQVAVAIMRAHEKRTDVIYVRSRWRLIMAIIRAIPERQFKRLSL
jgi:decaprenylphospho-beta-D-erythro-pentofuranosid-2-ulose 2-reductase